MGNRVVVVGSLPVEVVNRLSREVEVTVTEDGESLREMATRHGLDGVKGLLVTGQAPIDTTVLDAAAQLRVVSLRAVGYDRVNIAECRRRGVHVCTTPGVLEGAVADLTVLLMLCLARRVREALLCAEDDAPPPALGVDLRGKTLGIVGMGRIGQQVAATASRGFAMEVLYTSRSARPRLAGRQVSMEELLAESDVVSLHVPLSAETVGLIDSRALAVMKSTAFLVDTARPGLVDLPALTAALINGDIAGAALDVPRNDYPAPGSPLHRIPQLLLTPHIGSATEETRRAMADMAADNLLRVLRGDEALSCVTCEG